MASINGLQGLQNSTNVKPTQKQTPYEAQQQFSTMLNQSIEKLNGAQITSEKAAEKLANGGDIDLHQVMITAEKASVSLQLASEVRNKAVDAYKEMMRMRV